MRGAVSCHGMTYDLTEGAASSRKVLRKRDAPAIMELLQCSSRILQVLRYAMTH